MDAKEIRENQSVIRDIYGKSDIERASCWALHEIAAQLAELNATLREEVSQDEIEEVMGWPEETWNLIKEQREQMAAKRSAKPAQCKCLKGIGKCMPCMLADLKESK